MQGSVRDTPLAIALSCAIPIWIMQFKEAGGPSSSDFSSLPKISDLLGERGDVLLFGGNSKKDKGLCAELFDRTAKAIAILSFIPGGIDIFGMHFETKQNIPGGNGGEYRQLSLSSLKIS